MKKKFLKLQSEVTLYPGMSAWHFGHLDKKISENIKKYFGQKKSRGFGSIRVIIRINKTSWNTSIFPDKRSSTYLFPIKASIRKKEFINAGDNIIFSLEIV